MNPARVTIRARVLRTVNASHDWQTARAIAQASGLHYLQAVFALNYLHNSGAIARRGRKATAQWGSRVLVEHTPTASDALATLTSHFPHAADHHHP